MRVTGVLAAGYPPVRQKPCLIGNPPVRQKPCLIGNPITPDIPNYSHLLLRTIVHFWGLFLFYFVV